MFANVVAASNDALPLLRVTRASRVVEGVLCRSWAAPCHGTALIGNRPTHTRPGWAMLLDKYRVRCVRLGDQMGGGREYISHKARRGRMEHIPVQRCPRGHWGAPPAVSMTAIGVSLPYMERHGSGHRLHHQHGGVDRGGPHSPASLAAPGAQASRTSTHIHIHTSTNATTGSTPQGGNGQWLPAGVLAHLPIG